MKRRSALGFTLIELLASMSVLLLLIVVTSQLVGAVSSVFRSGKARIDIFTQARISFGALDRDVKQMVLRADLAAFPVTTDGAGNRKSAFAFYTRVQGGKGDRAISLVEYTLHDPKTDPDGSKPPLLVRRNYGMSFAILDPPRAMTFGDTTALTDLSNSGVESKELANGVIRLNWQFCDATGKAADCFTFDYKDPNADANTRFVKLSFLVLDEVSYNLLNRTGKLSTLIADTNGTPSGQSFGQYWQGKIDSSGLSSSLPKPVLQSVRVFERSFIIPTSR